MANKGEGKAPIIIIKRGGDDHEHAHHGGAWKVAYADFVTAMMAFFLLLWLLGATTETKRKGIADYFDASLTVSQNTNGANGVLGGRTVGDPGSQAADSAAYDPTHNSLPAQPTPADDETEYAHSASDDHPSKAEMEAEQKRQDDRRFAETEQALKKAVAEDPSLADLARNLAIDRTPEGLRIQLIDQANYSLFELGSAQMPGRTKQLVALVARAVANLPNKVSVRGHTDARPFTGGVGDNWRLSSDRALITRTALIDGGLDGTRVSSVVGLADTEPFVTTDPLDPRNRRLSLILLYAKPPAAKPAEAKQPEQTTPTPTAEPAK